MQQAIVMTRRVRLLPVLLVLAALAAGAPAYAASARPVSTAALDYPAAFAVSPDGTRIVYGERFGGALRVLNTRTGARSLLRRIGGLATAGEQGILGVALHPTYPTERRVWVFATRLVGGAAVNQLIRVAADGSSFKVLQSFPTTEVHNGGRIAFGPDRKLYVVAGDNGDPSLSQDLSSWAGKMLRFNADGTIPADNPVAGSPVIAYGIRNSFGFTFDTQTGLLWETDNGPECNDEINVLQPLSLGNYGWGPSWTCATPPDAPANSNQDGPSPILPALAVTPPPAFTGAAFCRSCGLGGGGRLFVGEFNTRTIRQVVLTAARDAVASHSAYYTHADRVLSVESPARGGPIYFSTSTNIYRLAP